MIANASLTLFVTRRYDDGKTFVVKDTEGFSNTIIPQYFKHNNFSSFVRQLNFYGFRKIKSGSLRITDAASSEESKYWQFRHEMFQRGRPDLLSQIRKNSSETVDKQEVDQLKSEIRDLKDALCSLNDDVARLKTLVACLVKNQVVPIPPKMHFPEVACKKRKAMGGEYLMPAQSEASIALTATALKALPPYSNGVNASWPDMHGIRPDAASKAPKLMNGGRPMSILSEASLTPLPIKSNGIVKKPMYDSGMNAEWLDFSCILPSAITRNGSIGGASLDEDVLASLLALENDDDLTFFEELDFV
jgi:HSF-type DNA-binding